MTKLIKSGRKDVLSEKIQDKTFMKRLMNRILREDAKLFKELAKH